MLQPLLKKYFGHFHIFAVNNTARNLSNSLTLEMLVRMRYRVLIVTRQKTTIDDVISFSPYFELEACHAKATIELD